MIKINVLLYVICLSFCLVACKVDNTKKYIKQWQGRDIEISNDVCFVEAARDTVLYDEYSRAKIKIFVYVGPVGCTSCNLKIDELKAFTEYLKRDLSVNVPVLLYFDNKNISKVTSILKTHGYKVPVCIDTKGELSSRYEFSNNLTHNAFLLDSLNRVILVGYPMHNKDIEKMYIDEILRRSSGG